MKTVERRSVALLVHRIAVEERQSINVCIRNRLSRDISFEFDLCCKRYIHYRAAMCYEHSMEFRDPWESWFHRWSYEKLKQIILNITIQTWFICWIGYLSGRVLLNRSLCMNVFLWAKSRKKGLLHGYIHTYFLELLDKAASNLGEIVWTSNNN